MSDRFISRASLVASILIPFVIFFWPEKVSQLELQLMAIEAFPIPESDAAKSKLAITYENKDISRARIMYLRVANQGDLPIRKEDYDKGIYIGFTNAKQVVEPEVLLSEPEGIRPEISEITRFGFYVSPTLLNPADQFLIRVFVEGEEAELKVTGRISGIKEINFIDNTKKNQSNFKDYRTLCGISLFLMSFGFLIALFITIDANWLLRGSTYLMGVSGSFFIGKAIPYQLFDWTLLYVQLYQVLCLSIGAGLGIIYYYIHRKNARSNALKS